jgi:hypothetical protein
MRLLLSGLLIAAVVTAFAPLAWAPPPLPVAVLTVAPNPGCVGELITFDGCESYHPEPSVAIVLYEFDFEGDGTYDWSSPTQCATTHFYMVEGNYAPVLRVTDEFGMEGTVDVGLFISGASAAEPSTWSKIKALFD